MSFLELAAVGGWSFLAVVFLFLGHCYDSLDVTGAKIGIFPDRGWFSDWKIYHGSAKWNIYLCFQRNK